MNSYPMNSDLQAYLKKHRQNEKYFTNEISYRFSDCMDGNRIHFSKLFEFFEMARFDIMEQFYTFYQKKKKEERIDLGNFVVIRIQSEISEAIEKRMNENILVKTNLIVHHKPLFEFKQIAYCQKEQLLEAKVKVVLVDQNMQTVQDWDLNVLSAILEFVDQKGKEESL